MSQITATCTCGLHTYHEHDAEDEEWFGPSAWYRRHPTDEAPAGTYCGGCGDLLHEGGAVERMQDLRAQLIDLRLDVVRLLLNGGNEQVTGLIAERDEARLEVASLKRDAYLFGIIRRIEALHGGCFIIHEAEGEVILGEPTETICYGLLTQGCDLRDALEQYAKKEAARCHAGTSS